MKTNMFKDRPKTITKAHPKKFGFRLQPTAHRTHGIPSDAQKLLHSAAEGLVTMNMVNCLKPRLGRHTGDLDVVWRALQAH